MTTHIRTIRVDNNNTTLLGKFRNNLYFGKITTSDPKITRKLLVYNKITTSLQQASLQHAS